MQSPLSVLRVTKSLLFYHIPENVTTSDKKANPCRLRTAVSGFPYGRHGPCGKKDPGHGSFLHHGDETRQMGQPHLSHLPLWAHRNVRRSRSLVPDLFPRRARAGQKGSRRRQYARRHGLAFYPHCPTARSSSLFLKKTLRLFIFFF